jgi:hypothetical protein
MIAIGGKHEKRLDFLDHCKYFIPKTIEFNRKPKSEFEGNFPIFWSSWLIIEIYFLQFSSNAQNKVAENCLKLFIGSNCPQQQFAVLMSLSAI